MAIARLWKVKVIASDIDPVAVRVALKNAGLNGLRTSLRCVVSDGLRSPLIRDGAPFDLIAANILQRPLLTLSPSIVQNLVPGGTVVLSGLLDSQTSSIVATYRKQGLHLRRRFSIDGWTTLVMARPHRYRNSFRITSDPLTVSLRTTLASKRGGFRCKNWWRHLKYDQAHLASVKRLNKR